MFEVERSSMKQSVELRRREFATGRALLRELMARRVPIPIDAQRRPILPSGIVGSLAHDRTFAVAAVSERPDIAALGIDIEPFGVLETSVAEAILRPDEHGLDPTLGFVVKEAVYKAWSSLGGEMLDFHDVGVELTQGFFHADVLAGRAHLAGRYCRVADRWLALVAVDTPRLTGTAGITSS